MSTTYVISVKGGRTIEIKASSVEEARTRARKMLADEARGGDIPPAIPTLDSAGGSRVQTRTFVGGRPGGVLVARTAPSEPSPNQRFRNLSQRLAEKGSEFGAPNFERFCARASDLSLESEIARDRIADLEKQLASADRRIADLEQFLIDSAPAAVRIAELEELLEQERARSAMASTSLVRSFDDDPFGEETKTSTNPLPDQARRTSAITAPSVGGDS